MKYQVSFNVGDVVFIVDGLSELEAQLRAAGGRIAGFEAWVEEQSIDLDAPSETNGKEKLN